MNNNNIMHHSYTSSSYFPINITKIIYGHVFEKKQYSKVVMSHLATEIEICTTIVDLKILGLKNITNK